MPPGHAQNRAAYAARDPQNCDRRRSDSMSIWTELSAYMDFIMLIIVLVVVLVLALGGGWQGSRRYGGWTWSPAAIILVVAVVLYFTGHLNFSMN